MSWVAFAHAMNHWCHISQDPDNPESWYEIFPAHDAGNSAVIYKRKKYALNQENTRLPRCGVCERWFAANGMLAATVSLLEPGEEEDA